MGNTQTKSKTKNGSKGKQINGKDAVKQKLLSSSTYRPHFEHDDDLLDSFSDVLSNVEELKRKYLSLDFLETVEVHKQLEEKARRGGSSGKKGAKMFESHSEAVELATKSRPVDLDAEDSDEEETLDQIIEEGKKIDQEMKLDKNTIKIKIVVVEVANTKVKKNVRRLISPIMSKFDLFPELGMFHSALMIGPWFIDWNNSAMCIPRKCVCKAALLSADIDAITSTEKIETIVDRLAETIVEWNTTMKYKDNNGRKGEEGNCQDFVDAILESLGLTADFNGPLGEFLKKLRTKGTCEMEFRMNEEFRKKFEMTEKKVKFENHKQLDLFVKNLLAIEPEFDTKYKQEWSMLKSFDRAFWLRHYKFEEDTKWQPHFKVEVDEEGDTVMELDCPFNDPKDTYSIRFLNS